MVQINLVQAISPRSVLIQSGDTERVQLCSPAVAVSEDKYVIVETRLGCT